MTCGKRKDNSFDPCLTNQFGRGDRKPRKGGRKERDFRERSSTFSLKFPVIGPSNPSEPRGKVAPQGKNYAWVSILWSFDKLRKVGVFSYFDIPCLKSHENDFGCCEAGMTMNFGSKEVGSMLDEGGLSMDSPRTVMGLLKVRIDGWTENFPFVLLACYCLS